MSVHEKAMVAQEMFQQALAGGISEHAQTSLAGIIEDSLNTPLKELIITLFDKTRKKQLPFEGAIRLHKEIVGGFVYERHGEFSLAHIVGFEDAQRYLKKYDLMGEEIWELASEHERSETALRKIEKYIQYLKPRIDTKKGRDLLLQRKSGFGYYSFSRCALELVKEEPVDRKTTYLNFFRALDLRDALSRRLPKISKRLSKLRQNHIPLSSDWKWSLEAFKKGEHPVYSVMNYASAYGALRRKLLGEMSLPKVRVDINLGGE